MNNSLLAMEGLPPFSKIKPEEIIPAIDTVLSENRENVKKLLSKNSEYNWDNLIQPLEEQEDRLSRIWSPVRHMNSVVNSDELREAYNACLPKLSDYSTEMGQNKKLFQAYQQIAACETFSSLDVSQQKTIKNALRDFRLSGVDLPEKKKKRFKEISQDLSKLTSKFEENLLDATNAWEKQIINKEQLSGLPESSMAMCQQTAENKNKPGYLLTLQFPTYYAVITYAENRELRKEIYRAYTTRASDQGSKKKWDNSQLMEEILSLRFELSQLLGFKNYAERSLFTKMAESPQEVLDFLNELAQKVKPAAEKEMQALRDFSKNKLGLENLQAWDIAFASEKLQQERYKISQEDLKPYFPVDQVVDGLFSLVNKLYGMKVKEKKDIDTWHPDVKFYEIRDLENNLRGQFYFDLYAREKKRGGAWMDECISRMKTKSGINTPVAYMTCNSTPPVGHKPALFTHDEVITLFHEFGHGLHHMLTQIDYPSVSGISGVEWDAVELPSQFMENWCWEHEALDLFARHYETGEKLPDELFKKMIASKNFQAAMQMVRQLEFSIFDIRIHLDYDPEKGGRIQETLDEVRGKVAVVKPPEFNRFQHGFSHIFAGGYAAGYYSYKWAEVLSADAFARFEEEGVFNPKIGQDFLNEILEVGGSRDAMESFKAFRGREPDIEALLRHNGLAV